MNELVAAVLRTVVIKAAESAAGALTDRVFRPKPVAVEQAYGAADHGPVYDPVSEAEAVTDAFLSALAARDLHALSPLCHPDWVAEPDTHSLLDETLRSAPPYSWTYREWYAPEGWQEGTLPEWLCADLIVTFDVGDNRYETIPAVLHAVPTDWGWLVDYLAWGEPAITEAHAGANELWEADSLHPFFHFPDAFEHGLEPPPARAIVECAGCEQKLNVPTDKGRLRVTCPRCRNAQWFTP